MSFALSTGSALSNRIAVGIILIGLVLLVILVPRGFQAPPPVQLTAAQAEARAGEWLLKLRPVSQPAVPLARYATSHTFQLRRSILDAEWEFGFYLKEEKWLYQIYLETDGSLRSFRVFHLVKAPETDSPVLSSEIALQTARQTIETAGLSRVLLSKPPEIDVTASVAGNPRRVVRWETNQLNWDGKPKNLQVTFEGSDLQAVELKNPDQLPESFTRRLLIGLTGIILLIGSFLPVIYSFFRDFGRREIGSRASLVLSLGTVLLANGSLFLTLMVITWSELKGQTAKYHTFVETLMAPTLEANLPYPVWVMIALIGILGIFITVFLFIPAFVIFSATESNDWATQANFLTDVLRVVRLRTLEWVRIRQIYLAGLAFGVLVLLLETVGVLLEPAAGGWLRLLFFSHNFAVGLFKPTEMLFLFFLWQAVVGFWLMPLYGSLLRIRNHPLGAGIVVVALSWLVFFLVINPSLKAASELLILFGLTAVMLVRFGWLTTALGWMVPFALFPLLWACRFPGMFQAKMLLGLPFLAIPALLGLVRQVAPRTGKIEEFEIAPPFVRERFQHERRKQELDIRWSIHQNLIPANGLVLRERSIAVEYLHLPDHGRELFSFIPLSPTRLGIAIGEVSGHGIEASMLLAVTMTTLKSKALRHPDSPAQTLEKINRFLAERLQQTNSTIQMVYGIADFEHSTFTFCNAGYVPPLLLKEKPEAAKALLKHLQKLPPLGKMDNTIIQDQIWKAAPGDALVLNSDWMWDLFDPESSPVRLEEKLCDQILPLQHLPAQELVRAIVAQGQSLQAAQGKTPIEITAVCVRF
ncbi:MAG: SpoIIE family protein phosphatase [Blastocatellia bacterium]|nr:SpoIIE family protein phosphatase [Blastocatellia bacterium]